MERANCHQRSALGQKLTKAPALGDGGSGPAADIDRFEWQLWADVPYALLSYSSTSLHHVLGAVFVCARSCKLPVIGAAGSVAGMLPVAGSCIREGSTTTPARGASCS